MAKGDWWIKFETRLWLTDPQLRRCSRNTRASWIDCLCFMREAGAAELAGTRQELAALLAVTPKEFDAFVDELARTKTADVTVSHNFVTLVSRRFAKEISTKEKNRLRQQKKRGHAEVTTESRDRVISKSKSNKKEVNNTPTYPSRDLAIHVGVCVSGISQRLKVKRQLPDEREWNNAAEWSFNEGFTADQFLECFDLMKKQKWRDSAITPKTLCKNLLILDKLRDSVASEANNGSTQKSSANHYDLADELERQGRAERAEAERRLLGGGDPNYHESDLVS